MRQVQIQASTGGVSGEREKEGEMEGELVQVERLRLICTEEGVDAEEEALVQLVQQSDGDLRKSVTTLQVTNVFIL